MLQFDHLCMMFLTRVTRDEKKENNNKNMEEKN